MIPSLHIVRGLPGSGKSTFAKTFECPHFEADMYFMRGGEYHFDANEIRNAHAWCQEETRRCLIRGIDVVVANTFTTLREMQFYLDLCNLATITVWCCKGDYGSIHDVPQMTIDRMKQRFVDYEGEVYVY